MSKIRILPDRVANQIAAGEVIERPAAVVKELVENSLDAGATRIEVEFRHGGRSLLRVEDNGSGMSRDDALLCLERHATSKINEAVDLDSLASYGFRGEALPSIASISRFTLQTREQSSDLGTEVLVNGGKLVHVRECGRPVGTRIEAAQLFHPVPARRKFLKTDQTEAAHIIQCVRLYALACPEVSFTLIEDGRTIFRSPECSSLVERVGEIFGRQIALDLIEIDSTEADFRIHGLIGKPGVGRATRHEMITFVNGRPVDSRTVNYALIESYHESLPKGRYPLAFVFFSLDPAAVDVNVHPAKREVRFRSEAGVRSFLIRSLLQRLREFGGSSGMLATTSALTPEGAIVVPVVPAPPTPQAPPLAPPLRSVPVAPPAAPPPGLPVSASLSPVASPAPAVARSEPQASPVPVPAPKAAPVNAAASWRFLGLAHGTYALFETPAGLVLLDRRAAQERVWFERLKEQFGQGAVPRQRLLLPIPLEVDPISTALLLDRLEFVNTHGFELLEFGRNFFRIEAVPDWMEAADAELFVRDLIGALRDGRLQVRGEASGHEEFARLAASKAVRLPATVTDFEMRDLLRRLFASSSPLLSPAGRPTFIEVSHAELNRRFQKS